MMKLLYHKAYEEHQLVGAQGADHGKALCLDRIFWRARGLLQMGARGYAAANGGIDLLPMGHLECESSRLFSHWLRIGRHGAMEGSLDHRLCRSLHHVLDLQRRSDRVDSRRENWLVVDL